MLAPTIGKALAKLVITVLPHYIVEVVGMPVEMPGALLPVKQQET
jgi:hypothetical protein